MPDVDELEAPRNACAECGREQPAGERGWKAFLTIDDEVAVFCPQCAEREFGDARPSDAL